MGTQIERLLLEFPEVRTVFCKTGRPEIANDVMGVHQTDVWVILNSHEKWRPGVTRDDLIAEMEAVLKENIVGVAFGFTQPIEMRVDELVAGVKSDVAVLLYGDDLEVLAKKSKEIERVLQEVPGAADVKADFQANLQTLTIHPRRDALARYGIDASKVFDVIESLGGRKVGMVMEGRARIPIVVRVPAAWREDIQLLEQLPVGQAGGRTIPLGELAEILLAETPASVEHDAIRRRTFVAANVRGRDVASFVGDAQAAVANKVDLPPGYEIRWGGDFENLQTASRRLTLITPVVLLLIFLLLHTSFRSVSLALTDLSGCTDGCQWRHLRAVPARHAIQHLCRRRLHRSIRRGRSQRTSLGERCRKRAAWRTSFTRSNSTNRSFATSTCFDDGDGREFRIHSHGDVEQ